MEKNTNHYFQKVQKYVIRPFPPVDYTTVKRSGVYYAGETNSIVSKLSISQHI